MTGVRVAAVLLLLAHLGACNRPPKARPGRSANHRLDAPPLVKSATDVRKPPRLQSPAADRPAGDTLDICIF